MLVSKVCGSCRQKLPAKVAVRQAENAQVGWLVLIVSDRSQRCGMQKATGSGSSQ